MTVTQIAIGLCATIKVCELIAATSELVTNAMKEVLPDGITAGGAALKALGVPLTPPFGRNFESTQQ